MVWGALRRVLTRLGANRPSLSRDAALDAIRGVAIILVVAYHFLDERSGIAARTGVMRAVGSVSAVGWTGVQLFFVLSGFLIGGILIDHRSQKGYFRTFYLRRVLRIVPLYALSLLIFALLYTCYDWRAAGLSSVFEFELPVWTVLTFTQNIFVAAVGHYAGPGWLGVTWSLCIEEQFYLLLPCLIYVVSPRRLPAVCLAAILSAPLFRTVLLVIWPDNALAPHVLLPGRLDALFLGVLAACLWRNEKAQSAIRRWRPAIAIAFAGMSILLIANLHRITSFGQKMQMIGYSVIAVYFFVAMLLAVSASKAPRWLAIARKPLCLAGTGAYSIYLFHRPVQALVRTALPGQPLLILTVSLLVVAMLSWACWQFIEGPAIRFGRRTFRYGEARWANSDAYAVDLPVASQLP
jgi:peptidoglycan/LPS O-acetylase OafA/YrhL